MNKEDYIGKYIALDCPSGALWAKVTGVVETNSIEGYSHSFVLEERKYRNGERIGRVKGKTLLKCSLINESNVFDLLNISEDEIDKIFLSVLSSSKNNLSALELMPVEMIKEIITKGSKNDNS